MRKTRMEQLESRRVLATLTVDLAADSPVLVDDGRITLREAIRYVNGEPVPLADQAAFDFANLGQNDLIKFDPRVFGAPDPLFPDRVDTIELLHGQLNLRNPVTIDGAAGTVLPGDTGPGWENLTIDASAVNGNTGDGLVSGAVGWAA